MGKTKLYEKVGSLVQGGAKACLTLAVALFLPLAASSQTKTQVQGTVIDQNNQPLAGAMVQVTGTKDGSYTDLNGKFSVEVKEGATLTVSFVGFEDQNVAAKNGMRVVLKETTNNLDELVFIGYGVAKKSDLTGAVGSVKSSQFNAEPIKNSGDILKGRMAGVSTSQYGGGQLGSGPSIRVRGLSSLKYGNDPLWVVDGIVGGSYASIQDVESIEVLKDAASTAIYGSRGANGVVLVTTKKGRAGQGKIEFSADLSVGKIAKKYDIMSPTEFADTYEATTGVTQFSRDENGQVDGYDYQKAVYKNLLYQDYTLTVSGGSEKTRYMITGHVLDQKGIVVGAKNQSMAVRANLVTDVKPWLTLTMNVVGSTSKSSNTNNVAFDDIINMDPTVKPVTDMSDYLNVEQKFNGASIMATTTSNPMEDIWDKDTCNKGRSLNSNIDVLIKILPGLTFDTQGSYNFGTSMYNSYQTKRVDGKLDKANNNMSHSHSYQMTNNLTYQHTFAQKHNLTVTGVYEVSKSVGRSVGAYMDGLQFPATQSWNATNCETHIPSVGWSANQLMSAFGRVMYNYDGKYFVTGTVRADGSSKFAKGNRWGWFPSAAVAWDIAKEGFMKDNGIFDQLKLRGSFGVTGNQAVGSYTTFSMLGRDGFSFGSDSQDDIIWGMWPKNRGNAGLKWETTKSYDVGIDASILDGIVSVNIDWYKKNTEDLIADRTLPIMQDGSWKYYHATYLDNMGKIYSTGLDFTVNAYPFRRKNFDWATTFTASWLKTKVTDLGGEKIYRPDASASGLRQYNFFALKEGLSASNFELFKWMGLNENGEDTFATADGGVTTTPDKSKDRFIMGHAIPKWTFGWNNSFHYKNWSASFLFRASTGFQRFNLTRLLGCAKSGDHSQFVSLREAHKYGWDFVADKSKAKFASLKNNGYNDPHSSRFLEDADFLRLENLSIAYTIPKSVARIADITLGVSGQNLFTITGYKGSDPESITNYDNDTTIGLDYGAYPAVRTFTFSVKLGF